jgi:hypothetical protein
MAENDITGISVPTNMPPEAPVDYKELIREVYLKTIRSAVIVDDDYITLENLIKLAPQKADEGVQLHSVKYKKLVDVIEACKASPQNWLVDVNDASNFDSEQYGNLHQSDLMILDYHLEKNTDGTKALKILRSLAGNNYFNLVIVYSNCDSQRDLESRVLEIARSLTYKNSNLGRLEDRSPEQLQNWEADENGISRTLVQSLSEETFLRFFQEADISKWQSYSGFEGIQELISQRRSLLIKERRLNNSTKITELTVKWILSEFKRKYVTHFSDKDFGGVDFSLGEVNWIRTNNIFVTVISKDVEASQLPEMLLEALNKSNPSPHQLIMTKIRNVMDEKGVGAEKNVLLKDHLQAYWLNEMLTDDPTAARKLPWKLKQTIRHHWDELASQINQDVNEYGGELFKSIVNNGTYNKKNFILEHTSLDITNLLHEKRIKEEWNSFVCNKPIDELHLMTGHLLKLSKVVDGNLEAPEQNTYWICLSPACDLVPGQKDRWGDSKIKVAKILPFKAIKLFKQDSDVAMQDATSSDFIFLKNGNQVESYSYFRKGQDDGNPVWDQFFAHDYGYIPQNKIFRLSAIRFADLEEITINKIEYSAEVVGQLRYEYALNLLQKLGGSLSRIGLDFVNHTTPRAV